MPRRTLHWFLALVSLLMFLQRARGQSVGTGRGDKPAQASALAFAATYTPVPTVTGWPTRTPTHTPTATLAGTSMPTVTPTSYPGPPTLLAPDDGALMPQPVPPGEWYFAWNARTGPCHSVIYIEGPGGRHISSSVDYSLGWPPYQYHYNGEAVPDDALGPWSWSVSVVCFSHSSASESRTFWVQTAATPTPTATLPVHPLYLPVVLRYLV